MKRLLITECNYHTEISDCVRLFLNTHKITERNNKYIASGYTHDGYMIVGLGKSPHAAKLMRTKNHKEWLSA